MPLIQVPIPGQPIPRIDKFANESIVYTLDCTKVLDANEYILSAISDNTNCIISDIRPKKFNTIEARISNYPLTTEVYVDLQIHIKYMTSSGNTRIAQFILRVYK